MLRITTPRHLGAAVRATRTAMNLAALDVAAMTGITAVTLRRVEQGNATDALQKLFKILDELGIEMYLSLPPNVGLVELPAPAEKVKRTRVLP
jgi:transcriptional regulator with XRE-family HTH domain